MMKPPGEKKHNNPAFFSIPHIRFRDLIDFVHSFYSSPTNLLNNPSKWQMLNLRPLNPSLNKRAKKFLQLRLKPLPQPRPPKPPRMEVILPLMRAKKRKRRKNLRKGVHYHTSTRHSSSLPLHLRT